MIVRGKSGRATGAPYKPNLTEPDSHELRFLGADPETPGLIFAQLVAALFSPSRSTAALDRDDRIHARAIVRRMAG